MATRTISNTGGNYNSTATWVEGAVPTSADDVVSTATSGQLTVNVSSLAQSINLSNYTNTLTMNNNLTISGASTTNTFGASMSFAGTVGIIIFTGNPQTIVQNTTNRIPNLRFQTTGSVKTLNTQIYAVNFDSNNQSLTINGATLSVSGNLGFISSLSTALNGVLGTSKLLLDGSGNVGFYSASQIEINTTGTYSTSGQSLVLKPGCTFSVISGNLDSTFTTLLMPESTSAYTVAINSSVKIPNLSLYNASNNSAFRAANLTLLQTLNVENLICFDIARTFTTDASSRELFIRGAGLSASNVFLTPFFRTTSAATPQNTFLAPNLRLNSDFTHTIGSLMAIGGFSTAKSLIASITASSAAIVNLGDKETSQIINVDFTDIDASGGEEIVAINGTLTRTTNVTSTYPSGGGVAGGSFTFVN